MYSLFSQPLTFAEEDRKFDILSNLPLEISSGILRMLDPVSLQNATLVCKSWNAVYKSDKVLRPKMKRDFSDRKQRMITEAISAGESNSQRRHSPDMGINMELVSESRNGGKRSRNTKRKDSGKRRKPNYTAPRSIR